jgi:hypothetical protein
MQSHSASAAAPLLDIILFLLRSNPFIYLRRASVCVCMCARAVCTPRYSFEGIPCFKASERNAPCVSFNPAALRFSILARLQKDIDIGGFFEPTTTLGVCMCESLAWASSCSSLFPRMLESDSLRTGYVILKGEVDFIV